jgi:hypothetical protein
MNKLVNGECRHCAAAENVLFSTKRSRILTGKYFKHISLLSALPHFCAPEVHKDFLCSSSMTATRLVRNLCHKNTSVRQVFAGGILPKFMGKRPRISLLGFVLTKIDLFFYAILRQSTTFDYNST